MIEVNYALGLAEERLNAIAQNVTVRSKHLDTVSDVDAT
jgi:hypothetical protein